MPCGNKRSERMVHKDTTHNLSLFLPLSLSQRPLCLSPRASPRERRSKQAGKSASVVSPWHCTVSRGGGARERENVCGVGQTLGLLSARQLAAHTTTTYNARLAPRAPVAPWSEDKTSLRSLHDDAAAREERPYSGGVVAAAAVWCVVSSSSGRVACNPVALTKISQDHPFQV